MTSAAENQARTPLAEEMASTAIQAAGVVMSVIGLVVLINLALPYGALPIATVAVYGVTLVTAYLASALYHGVWHPGAKRILRTIDHCAIYLLIAGTYTPVALLVVGDRSGWALMAAVWGLALAGIVLRVKWPDKGMKLRLTLYLVLGWLIIAWVGPVYDRLGGPGTLFIVAGGLAYSSGVPFYRWESLPFNQAVWHLFVLTGSACFFAAIALYVLPALGG